MVDTTGIPTETDIRNTAQRVDEQQSYWREAFRDHTPSNGTSRADFPEIEGGGIDPDSIEEVPEGAEYPEVDLEYGENILTYSKYGALITLTDEAIEDGAIAVELDAQRELLAAESKRMDALAGNLLRNSAQASGVGDNGDSLATDELIDARAWMKSESTNGESYTPDLCFVESMGAASLLKSMKDRQTADGDDALRNGEIGTVANMTIIEVERAAGMGQHNAVLVDSDKMGWESVKRDKDTEQERRMTEDKTLYRVSDRLGWIVVKSAAAAVVEG